MSYECTYCNFNAPTNTRLNRHLSTQKHIRNVLSKQIHDESQNILNEIIEENVQEKEEKEEEVVELCENMDCERYPPDWDFESDTPETYEEGQWIKCCLCDGYFNDDGLGDILFIEEVPNNRGGGCDLCGKTDNIVQMKGSGQYLCGDACDEEEEEEVSQSDILPNNTIQIESVQEETIIQIEEKEQKIIFDIEEEREVTIDNILLNSGIIMNSVQEDKKEVVKFDENIEYIENSIESEIIFIETPILDIQTIEMLKDFNELVTTHGFLLNILSFIMNIVRFFAPNNTGVSPL
jgi:hypothetical protein